MSFSSYKYRAKKNKMLFNVPEQVFHILKQRPCYYCRTVKDQVGIDRIDNKRGYVSGNCIPACWDCNRSKSNKTLMEYREYLMRFNKGLKLSKNPLVVHWFYDSDGEIYTRIAPASVNLGNNFNTFFRDDFDEVPRA